LGRASPLGRFFFGFFSASSPAAEELLGALRFALGL
jgi:hypothetical protein